MFFISLTPLGWGYLPSNSMIACLLICVFSNSFISRSSKKMSVYSLYSLRISDKTYFCCKKTINRVRKEYINIADFSASKAATWKIKMFVFSSSPILTNSRLLIISTLLATSKASTTVYDLLVSFLVSNSQFKLLRDRKGIPNTIFILLLANKKFFS